MTLTTDVLIYGATAPAIVAAVRAAREGLDVIVVQATEHLGGSFPSLGAVETHYRGVRAPLLQEYIDRVAGHYRERYGRDSPQFQACTAGVMTTFEPHVAESILRGWIEAEPRIRLRPGYMPARVETSERLIQAVIFRDQEGNDALTIKAASFVEASDEGDLMAKTGVLFRIGREGREEFHEPRAGRVFTQWHAGTHPRAAAAGLLNLVTAKATTGEPLPGSTGDGDDNIQSYSFRLCLSDDPENRRPLAEPPPGYRREDYLPILLRPAEKERLPLPFHHRFLISSLRDMAEGDHVFHGHALPNRKRSWNAGNLTGGGKHYAAGGQKERAAIEQRHREHALGLMYFLQNDPAVPAEIRAAAQDWGLARDEFTGTENLPPHLYVREARRLVGREVFTERDALLASGLGRAPVHGDSIGITEFSLDSLACTTDRLAGSLCDGQFFQMEVTRPGQVAFGSLLPRELDNLLVITTLSATHVGWGALRQTPTLMHLAESAAWALVLAARAGVPPATLGVEDLQRHLIANRVLISFFNDVDVSGGEPWLGAVQHLATLGFFSSYDARPDAPLARAVAEIWSEATAALAAGDAGGENWAARVHAAEEKTFLAVEAEGFRRMLRKEFARRSLAEPALPPATGRLTRAAACRWCYQLLSAD